MSFSTPETTRSSSPINMPVDILRINPRLYSGFRGTDVDGNVIIYPTYQAAVQAWAAQVSPNYKQWIESPNINQDGTWVSQPKQPTQPSEVDKYIQGQIDQSRTALNPQQPTPIKTLPATTN